MASLTDPAIKNIVTAPRWDVSHVDCAKQRDCASAFGFFSIGFWIGILLSLSPCFVAGFIKAKQRLKGGTCVYGKTILLHA